MAHFGTVVPSLPGHLRPTLCLARTLVTWGHRVTLFSTQDAESMVLGHGIDFQAIGGPELGRMLDNPEVFASGTVGRLSGLNDRVDRLCSRIQVLYRELPEKLMRAEVDAVLVDQVEAGALDVAEDLKLPRVVLAPGLLMRPVEELPPPYLDWPIRGGRVGRWRNRVGNMLMGHAFRRWCQAREDQRDDWALPPPLRQFGVEPGISYILQQPDWFDAIEPSVSTLVHPTGPWSLEAWPRNSEFPWSRLDQRPLVYVNLGNRVDIAEPIYRAIAQACVLMDLQLVITCASCAAKERFVLAGGALVVPFVPQTALLERASIFVTHAGLTSVLESLEAGVPMIAIPMVDTQPGIASRLRALGVAEVIAPGAVNAEGIRSALGRLVGELDSRIRAKAYARRLAEAPQGVRAAADWVEKICLPLIQESHSGSGLPFVSGANQIRTAPTR